MSEAIVYEVRVRGIDEDFYEHVCTEDYRVADEAFTQLLSKVSRGGGAVQIVAIFMESNVEAVMACYVRHPVNLMEDT